MPKIAKEAKQRGIAQDYVVHDYEALVGGELKHQVLARLSIPDGAGSDFLQKYPNIEDWPDLEGETERESFIKEEVVPSEEVLPRRKR